MNKNLLHLLRLVEGEGGSTAGAPPKGAEQSSTPPKPTPPADPGKGDELGENGKKALQSEREARKGLEKQIQDMQNEQKAQMAALAEAFGVKPDAKAGQDDVLKSLQEQMASMQRSNLVSQIALESGITDKDDIALIESASSEEGMRRIAERIKADPSTPSTPKPDRSQGGQGGEGAKPEAKPGVSRMTQGITDALQTKS